MMNRISFLARFIVAVSLSAAIAGLQSSYAQADHKSGVPVEKISENTSAEKAGLQAGDVLLRWTLSGAAGEIGSPFDVSQIEMEQGPRGSVTLEGLRGREKRTWTLAPGVWGLKTRPNLPPDLFAQYQQGQELAKGSKRTEAAMQWQSLADKTGSSSPPWLHLWLLSHTADVLAEASEWKEVDALYEEAVQKAATSPSEIQAQLFWAWARTFEQRADWVNAAGHYQQAADESQKQGPESLLFADSLDGIGASASESGDLAKAEKCYTQAFAIQQKLAPGSLNLAKSLYGLGLLTRRHGDLAKAEEYFNQALAIRQKLAPGSLEVAASLTSLGNVAWIRGDLAKAEEYFLPALDIREKLAPGSLDVARSLNNLGAAADTRGDLAKAEDYFRRSLEIKQKLAPGSLDAAGSLNNLGKVTWDRGDLIKAEECYRQALAIEEKLAPNSLNMSAVLINLGLVAENRGDLDQAEEYMRKGLAIRQKVAPESMDVAQSLNNLGNVASYRGQMAEANEYYRQNLVLCQKLAPDSLEVAAAFSNLGVIARNLGDMAKAEEYDRQSLVIEQKLAPNSLSVAGSLEELGNLVRDRGDLAQAEDYYRQSLAIQEKLAPERKNYAETLARLAEVLLRKKQIDEAAPFFERALNALEGQTSHLGGTEDVRANFRADFAGYYQDYIDLLVRQKHTEQAFQVLERSRARSLLEMLAAAHVDIRRGTNAALLERERSLESDISAKFNRRIHLLSGKHSDEQIATISQEIEKLLAEHKEVEEEIRASSPSYAALTQPQPLSAKQTQQLLDDDTLLLAYSLGSERSYVFALTRGSLEAYPLASRAEIELQALHSYQELSVNDPTGDHKASAALSHMLLASVSEHLNKKRLAIVADGALQYIPFAALQSSQGVPLIAGHEIVNLPSASTLALLRKETEARPSAPRQVAVLADPVFDSSDERLKPEISNTPNKSLPKDNSQNQDDPPRAAENSAAKDSAAADLLTRSAADLGMTTRGALLLPRLPSTRLEAEGILAAASAGQTLEALDFDANRATATSPALAQYRIVHFATHGLLNSAHPELSGLVLSLVNRQGKPQNGFLDLQDIYNLNLPADLVVLSACQTGLGQQIQGEGLIGMTRAFMYAGSPRVVASLWRVPDRATAELMKQFYIAMLREGLSPAAALRKAQITLSKEKRWSAPYYWAAFTLQGEWK